MGILPLQFKDGQSADTLGLNGSEKFDIDMQGGNLKVGQDVVVKTDTGKTFTVVCRLDTDPEIAGGGSQRSPIYTMIAKQQRLENMRAIPCVLPIAGSLYN